MTPGFLAIAGLVGLVVIARRRPRFARLALLSLLGAIGFVCVVWHYETRYFTLLIPLLAISLGGAIDALVSLARRRGGAVAAFATAGVGIGAVALQRRRARVLAEGRPELRRSGAVPLRLRVDRTRDAA